MHEKAVLGLIGVGYLAQKQHLPNMARLTDINLKWICDLNEKLLVCLGEKYSIPRATMNYHEVLDDPDVEGVVIATKEDVQAKITIDALNAGKHVYVEKPLAETEKQCVDVCEAQRKSDKIVTIGFNRRFAPAYAKAKEILQKQGGAFNIHYRLSDGLHYKKYSNGKNKSRPWIRKAGSRVIYELCHIFDLLRWFSDSEVQSVYCASSRPDDEIYAISMESGCLATIMHTGYSSSEMPKERFEAVAKTGALTVEQFVELRTFGCEGAEPVYFFGGHTHPDSEYLHKYLFEELGSDAVYAVRRIDKLVFDKIAQEVSDINILPELSLDRAALVKDIKKEFPGKQELIDYYIKLINFSEYRYDKGWMRAMEDFAQSIITGELSGNASTAEDGLRASMVSHASIKSRESNTVVFVKDTS